MEFAGFDWDDGNRDKCQKHGVTPAEIEALFGGQPHIGPDPRHSDVEQRFRAAGRSTEGRAVFVVFTFRKSRAGLLLRPISARYMHRKEVQAYEKAFPGV